MQTACRLPYIAIIVMLCLSTRPGEHLLPRYGIDRITLVNEVRGPELPSLPARLFIKTPALIDAIYPLVYAGKRVASRGNSSPVDSRRQSMSKRPVGVTIFAVLHLVGGVLLVGVLLFGLPMLFANLDRVTQVLDKIGVPPILLVASLLFLTGISLASGIGLWLGTRWGWWCTTFFYVYSITRNANALLTVSFFADALEGGSRGPEYYYAKFGGRVIIHFLFFLYFFKANVLEYFGMENLHKWKAVGILILITGTIFEFSTIIASLAG